MKRAVVELFAVAGDAGDVWAGAVVEPDQLTDERDLLLAPVAEGRAERILAGAGSSIRVREGRPSGPVEPDAATGQASTQR